MAPNKVLQLALIVGGVLLAGAEECQTEGTCSQGPVEALSAWTECSSYTEDETVWIHLSNQYTDDLYVLEGCLGSVEVEELQEDGSFLVLPPMETCVSGDMAWRGLSAPDELVTNVRPELMEEGNTLPLGTYRARFTLGLGCTEGPTASPDEACETTDYLYSQVFNIVE